jgi:hypothetical protein
MDTVGQSGKIQNMAIEYTVPGLPGNRRGLFLRENFRNIAEEGRLL